MFRFAAKHLILYFILMIFEQPLRLVCLSFMFRQFVIFCLLHFAQIVPLKKYEIKNVKTAEKLKIKPHGWNFSSNNRGNFELCCTETWIIWFIPFSFLFLCSISIVVPGIPVGIQLHVSLTLYASLFIIFSLLFTW